MFAVDTTGDSLKQKQTWKGRVARAILSYGSGPALACADVGVREEPLGVIGVPLENCSSSIFNEVREFSAALLALYFCSYKRRAAFGFQSSDKSSF